MSTAHVSLELSGPQHKALRTLLAGGTTAEAARACGVSPRTLRDWLRQTEFHDALLEGQAELLRQTSLQLAAAAVDAVRTLVEISRDPNQKGSVRVAASGKLLQFLLRCAPPVATPAATTPEQTHAAEILAGLQAALERAYGDPEEDLADAAPAPAAPSATLPACSRSVSEIPALTSAGPAMPSNTSAPDRDGRRDLVPQSPAHLTVPPPRTSRPVPDVLTQSPFTAPAAERPLTLGLPPNHAGQRSP